MKILKEKLILLLVIAPFFALAQPQLDCSDFFKYRVFPQPWAYNTLSKSAVCLTGTKYEFNVPLTKGTDYRLSFYASPVFNNNIQFRVVDQGTGKTVMDLPGESETAAPWSCVLKDFYDEKSGKTVHPFFDFYPETSTILKIIIDVKGIAASDQQGGNAGYKAPEQKEKGCVTVLILSKPSDRTGFAN